MPYKNKKRRYAWYADRRRKIRQKRRAILAAIKAVPCTDCGIRFPPECMDFDHVRGKKLFNVALTVGRSMSDTRFYAEIAKCEVVCANCHRTRTEHRRKAREMIP